MSQVDARCVVQVDIENDTKSLAEIFVIAQGFGGIEQNGFETVLPQETFHASPHRRIVIDDKNGFSIWQGNIPQAETANISQRFKRGKQFFIANTLPRSIFILSLGTSR